MEIVVIYIFLIIALSYSLIKDKKKTRMSFKVASKVFTKMFPMLLIIIGLVGLILGFFPPEAIESYLGKGAGYSGTIIASIVGSITFIPSLIALPLAGSLLRSGAAEMTIAAFITTLTMVGLITLPLELKELGKRFAFLRNMLGFVFALIIALIMGLFLS